MLVVTQIVDWRFEFTQNFTKEFDFSEETIYIVFFYIYLVDWNFYSMTIKELLWVRHKSTSIWFNLVAYDMNPPGPHEVMDRVEEPLSNESVLPILELILSTFVIKSFLTDRSFVRTSARLLFWGRSIRLLIWDSISECWSYGSVFSLLLTLWSLEWVHTDSLDSLWCIKNEIFINSLEVMTYS